MDRCANINQDSRTETIFIQGVGVKAYLIAGRTPRFQPLSVVSSAEDFALLVEVNEIHQELVARAAYEAPRVPAHAVTGPGCKYSDVASVNLTAALKKTQNKTL